MLTFFRRIRKGLLGQGATSKYLLYAVGEIALVVIGILIALQINNWNEGIKNKIKGIEYLNSLYEDLKQDSIHLSFLIDSYQGKMGKLSMMENCYDSIVAQEGDDCLKSLISKSSSFENIKNIDRSIQQLKYEGGSLLLSSEDWNKVLVYDMKIAAYKIDESTVFQETQTSLRTLMHEFINFESYRIDKSSAKMPILINDHIILNKYFNTLKLYRDYCLKYFDLLHDIRSLNIELRTYLQEKYQFD